VVRHLPADVNNRPLANFNYAITSVKAHRSGCLNQVDMSPLEPVIVNVISDLTKQDPLMLENAVRFLDERTKSVGKIVVGVGR
jgi:hypothetical protein